jgi:hypothetical protein
VLDLQQALLGRGVVLPVPVAVVEEAEDAGHDDRGERAERRPEEDIDQFVHQRQLPGVEAGVGGAPVQHEHGQERAEPEAGKQVVCEVVEQDQPGFHFDLRQAGSQRPASDGHRGIDRAASPKVSVRRR